MTEPDLGPWSGDDFRATVQTAIAGLGLNAGVPDAVRFLASVVRLVRLRLVADSSGNDPLLPSVFVLKPSPPVVARALSHAPVINSGQVPIAGKIWFVSEFANSGRAIEVSNPSDLAEVFSVIVNELELGEVPALLFDPRTATNEVRYYAKGLAFDDECDKCDLSAEALSIERIFDVIDKVWLASLAVPKLTQPFSIWINASKNVPDDQAESKIQGLLRTGLQAAIPSCEPRVEFDFKTGRADIVIEEADLLEQSKVIYRAILELKVFRSRSSNNKPVAKAVAVRAANDGIDQVVAYAAERKAPLAALCCFDMRSACEGSGALPADVRKNAAAYSVRLAVWFLFSSAAMLRQFKKHSGSNFRQHY